MTFFMERLAEVLGTRPSDDEIPAPQLRPSRLGARGDGVDKQVILRSLAEQYVSEANAVIEDPADHLELRDEVGGNELAFVVSCRDHLARVSTLIEADTAYGQIISADLPGAEAYELEGPEALPDLIIRLCLVAGLQNKRTTQLS
ncbi:hypothetical protein B0O41_2316 [Propionibacteriaceae bacterium ES.041]|uniref:hypothetical protein n=1 Tax=Enemella evansiae TaxID=2016499 RepID=UPI000B96A712|nr:hypothetical protein [Enemella evansiae]OYN98982.1 hypothetical protein CGZ96_06885 [Enemella evansiae]OYO04992.1 hypothetical protein CGZ95_01400 [Enemella evansiae]PFG67499.1 hypothetical protein B0O41_2316 [Propionibacteriaceae bacterium ES.041]